jgi:aspartate kinase
MALFVHKYGGTSMGSVQRIQNVAQRIKKWVEAGHQVVVVPSAMSGETNRLLGLAREIDEKATPRELDMLASTGEQASVALLAIALNQINVPAVSYAGWQLPIITDQSYTKARIKKIETERVFKDLAQGRVVVITGFQGVDESGHITTLGRGGSDTSAVAVAAALQAQECLIYTDVDGVYTTDPRVVDSAKRLDKITFEEMLEMASLGSKVLQIRSVEFAGKYRVKTRVLSSLTDVNLDLTTEMNSGTLITFEEDETMEQAVISGIAFARDEAKITLKSVKDHPGVAADILGPVAQANVDIDMIIQNQSFDGRTDFTFTVARADLQKTLSILEDQVKQKVEASQIFSDSKVSKVSVVGMGMRSHVGVASQMFKTLAAENINIQLISTSEIKISVLIDEKYMEVAVRSLHKAFELEA